MKAILTLIASVVLSLLYVSGGGSEACAQQARAKAKTTIYLVRHAEKVTTDPQDKDPLLTPEGLERAEELRKFFSKKKVDALYSTDYQRTRLTLAPLAREKGKEINSYSSRNHRELVEKVLTAHKGQTVVIAGHSNSLLDLLKAFQAETTIKEIGEDEYSYLFKLTLHKSNQAKLEVGHYGKISKPSLK